MIRALLRKELQSMLILVLSCIVLGLFLDLTIWTYSHYRNVSDQDLYLVRRIALAGVLPSLYAILIASHVVAGEKQSGNWISVLDLPLAPGVLWGFKYFVGIVTTLILGSLSAGSTLFVDPAPPSYVIFFFSTLILIYSASFLCSCLSRHSLLSAIISTIVAAVSLAVGYFVSLLFLVLLHNNSSDIRYIFSTIPSPLALPPVYLTTSFSLIAIILTWQSYIAVSTTHRRSKIRLMAFIRLPAVIFLLLLGWFAVIGIKNTFFRVDFKPRFVIEPISATISDASYSRFAKASHHLLADRRLFSNMRISDIMQYDNLDIGDTPIEFHDYHISVNETEVVRKMMNEWLTTMESEALAFPVEAMNVIQPNYFSITAAFHEECIGVQSDWANGKRTRAIDRLERIIRVANKLTETGSIQQVRVAQHAMMMASELIRIMVTSDNGIPSVKRQLIADLLSALRLSMRARVIRALMVDAVLEDRAELSKSRPWWLRPPFADPGYARQRLRDRFVRAIEFVDSDVTNEALRAVYLAWDLDQRPFQVDDLETYYFGTRPLHERMLSLMEFTEDRSQNVLFIHFATFERNTCVDAISRAIHKMQGLIHQIKGG